MLRDTAAEIYLRRRGNTTRVNRLRPLEGVNRLDVGHVPHHVEVEQDPVAAEHVAGLGDHLARLAGVVHLGERGDRVGRVPPRPVRRRGSSRAAWEGPEASVAAVDLHVHVARGERAHGRTAVALDLVPHEPELAQPAREAPRKLRLLPVVTDHRQDLVVDEQASALEQFDLGRGQLVADVEVVGAERLADPREVRALDDRPVVGAHLVSSSPPLGPRCPS